jgi:glycosyltransferase involved in cell wall biosynthesis
MNDDAEDSPAPPNRGANDDVTIVITCFNYGGFLAEAVQSALHQNGGEPRVTVVDDGSTDETTLLELERLPERVELIRQANGGVAAARNTGLRRVQTDYALVLDADDRLPASALSTLRAPLEADPRLGFSHGLMHFFGEWDGVLPMPEYDPYGLLFRHTIGTSALMRRELVDDVGGFDSELAGYEDWDFWLGALHHGWRGRRVNEVTLMYRRHGGSRHLGARGHYRAAFAQLRRKYPDLYGRAGRRRLAAESKLGPWQRFVYRWWWGWRPVPARVELALQALRWRPSVESASSTR